MIKEYQITNFKPFAGPAIIPIKPITLIFGANSSGKSCILQSILMLKQTLDAVQSPEPTLLSEGKLVNLGRYEEFIHRHDIERSFSFKVTVQRPKEIDDAFPVEDYLSHMHNYDPRFEKLNESVGFDTMGIGVTFSYDQNFGAMVSRIELFLGDDSKPILTYEHEPPDDTAEKYVHRMYRESPNSFLKIKHINRRHKYWKSYPPLEESIRIIERSKRLSSQDKKVLERMKQDGIIDIDEMTRNLFDIFDEDFILLRGCLPELLNGDHVQYIIHQDFEREDADNISLFTLSVSYLIRQFLETIIHLGPLRPYPNPDILIKDKEFMERIDEINVQFNCLNLGYELKIVHFSSQASDIHDEPKLRLYDKSTGVHLRFTDVGVGVGQVFPIIFQSISKKNKTLLIEQPELHLHPALQAELGDLFIKSALGEQKNTLIIETHSEHLLLRVMRRMRETTSGKLPKGLLSIRPEDVMVLFVKPDGSRSIIHEMPLNKRGELVKEWPGGFFEEDFEELF